MSKTDDALIDIMNYELTEWDARLAMYWEHYDAGGKFDYIPVDEYERLFAQVDRAREWVQVNGMPAEFKGLNP